MRQIKKEEITTDEKNKSRNRFGVRILTPESFRLVRFIRPLARSGQLAVTGIASVK